MLRCSANEFANAGLLKVLKNQGLLKRSQKQGCDHLYIDVAGELHIITGALSPALLVLNSHTYPPYLGSPKQL